MAKMSFPAQVNNEDVEDEEEGDALLPSHPLGLSPCIMMRRHEAKTWFSGPGIYANLIAQFPGLRSFAEEIRSSNPILAWVHPDLERLNRGLWKQKPLSEPFPEPTTDSLVSLLPSRVVGDELIQLYLTYIESTQRILHVPSFLQEVDDFWALLDSPNNVSTEFVVQLLLVFACAWNFTDACSLQEKSTTAFKCYAAVEWVLHAEKWIEIMQIKRPDIATLRLYILLITAQNCHGMKRSKAWLAAGTLVKQAMLAGYHRDPSKYAQISVFNAEMRRRIWMAIVELDLQVAIDRGMPPSVQSSDYDTIPALNINDNELYQNSIEAPEGRPFNELTDMSFQTALGRSLSIRLKACSLMHSPRVSCRYEKIERLSWKLSQQLCQIPGWTSLEANNLVVQNKINLWKAMIETKLAQILLLIHTPFPIEGRRESLFAPSAQSRLDAAVIILSTQRRLYETSQLLSLCMLGEWTVQAYISICQLLHTLDSHISFHFQPGTTLIDSPLGVSSYPSSFLFHMYNLPGFPDALLALIDTVLIPLKDRSLLAIKGAKDYFFLSTIVALVKAKLRPAQAAMYKQQMVERILSFAQTLFWLHANCEHLGTPGMGSFNNNQVAAFITNPDAASVLPSDLDGILPSPNLGVTQPVNFDQFLNVFDWEDLTKNCNQN